MPRRIVLIHTVPPLIEVFSRLARDLLPGVQTLHVLDEPLLERVRARGGLAAEDAQRLGQHVDEAVSIGAEAVLVTCSTVSPCVDDVRSQATIPVLKIDEAMIAQAVRLGGRIGVIATNQTTLAPTQQLLEGAAQKAGKEIEITLVLVEHALAALLAGDGATHDRLVNNAICVAAERVDVIVLAQASMARALKGESAPLVKTPLLASPQIALAELASMLRPS